MHTCSQQTRWNKIIVETIGEYYWYIVILKLDYNYLTKIQSWPPAFWDLFSAGIYIRTLINTSNITLVDG